ARVPRNVNQPRGRATKGNNGEELDRRRTWWSNSATEGRVERPARPLRHHLHGGGVAQGDAQDRRVRTGDRTGEGGGMTRLPLSRSPVTDPGDCIPSLGLVENF